MGSEIAVDKAPRWVPKWRVHVMGEHHQVEHTQSCATRSYGNLKQLATQLKLHGSSVAAPGAPFISDRELRVIVREGGTRDGRAPPLGRTGQNK